MIVDFVMNHTSDRVAGSNLPAAVPTIRIATTTCGARASSSPAPRRRLPRSGRQSLGAGPEDQRVVSHHFLKHQPDLNIVNPTVQESDSGVLGFWLESDVSGFRVDAVPFLFARDGVPGNPGAPISSGKCVPYVGLIRRGAGNYATCPKPMRPPQSLSAVVVGT